MYEEILAIIAGLTGLGTLVSVLINIGKTFGIVKDGTSDIWYKGLSILVFIVIAVFYWLETPVEWMQVDSWLKAAATILGLLLQVLGGKAGYTILRGAPIIGYSYPD